MSQITVVSVIELTIKTLLLLLPKVFQNFTKLDVDYTLYANHFDYTYLRNRNLSGTETELCDVAVSTLRRTWEVSGWDFDLC
jgi:hypothetical protein